MNPIIAKKEESTKIDLNKLANNIDSPEEIIKKPYKCCTCGKRYTVQKNNFSYSQSPFFKGNNSYLPICRSCVDSATEQYTEKLGGQDEAIKRMALHWDMYVSDSLLSSSKKIDINKSRMSGYIKDCNLTQNANKTYDTYLDEQKTDVINSIEDLEVAQEKTDNLSERNTIKTWGFGFSPEEFIYLNNQYSDWKSKVVIDSKARETLVRDLCIIKMHQQNAIKNKDIDLYNKLQKTYQDTLTSANLKPIQEDTNDKNGEIPIGLMIDRFENEQPILEPQECFKDVDGIMRLINVFFLGHLCKMLGLKNRFSKMYEDEMAKYRVEVPELEDLDDEDVFDFLSNNSFDISKGDIDGD